jgi:hypothetical protein
MVALKRHRSFINVFMMKERVRIDEKPVTEAGKLNEIYLMKRSDFEKKRNETEENHLIMLKYLLDKGGH